ncbi:ATP-binding protein [Rubrivivax albus]|uniref:Tetratricopeptide repeat protein n=1 Tax=Rubrivivax albus TaxID=2499835 RepID=A0A3S2UAS8_9BURK|nr:tetratricopeptide repeat protein [Rubrivivax albus]RVT53748.1 tetratricopeptide repeat protein [Rubrivivax albus]
MPPPPQPAADVAAVADGPPVLRLFGPPALQAGSSLVPFTAERRFQLLTVLALADGQWIARERLGQLLWPAHGAAAARSNLRTVVHRARLLPGAQAVEATEHAVRWVVDHDVRACLSALGSSDPDTRADAVTTAGQPLLEGLDDPANPAWSDWLDSQRRRVAAAWQSAAWDWLAQAADPAARAALADRLLSHDALDETAMTAWLEAAMARGQGAAARQRFRAFAHRLAEELGIEPAQHLRDLMARLDGSPPTAGATPDTPSGRPRIVPPDSGTDFVGRQQERAEAQALLARADCRLLTLLGPGGVGKSRLARVVAGLTGAEAAHTRTDFPGGAWWVDLQDLTQAAALLPRLAQQLGLQTLDEPTALAQVAAALPAQRCLMVLDNAEHLLGLPGVDTLQAVLDGLLAAHPGVCLLVTSRVRLGASGPLQVAEWLLPVPGLAVPDEDSRDLDAASAFDAVQLFDRRARQADPRFALAAHVGAVVDIAAAVGGMPLALELAASWVRLMPPAAIADELRRSLDLLQRHPSAVGQPARPEHVSVRDVLAQSVAMLSPLERQALAAVSMFQDGFSRDAARALGRLTALPLLSALTDRGLLAIDADDRFRLHPLVQTLGAELLAADPALATATRQAHARHFARYMAELAPLTRGNLRQLVVAIDAEFANICRAWDTSLEEAQGEALGHIVRALWVYFEVTGRLQEGIRRLRPALQRLESMAAHDAPSGWALSRLRHGLSMLMHRGGHQADGLAVAETGMAAGIQAADLEALVGCLLNSGSCLMALGRLTEAHARFEQALALARTHDDTHCVAWALGNLAVSHSALGDADAAIAHGEQALQLDRQQGNLYQVAVHLVNLGGAQLDANRLAAAIDWTRQAVQHCHDHGLTLFELHARSNLAGFLMRDGRVDEARALTLQCLQAARAQGLLIVQAMQLTMLARMEVRAGRLAAALPPIREALGLARGHGLHSELPLVLRTWAALCEARGQVVQAARVLQCAIGMAATSPSDARFFGQLLSALPLDDRARAEAAEQPLTPDEALADIEADRPR